MSASDASRAVAVLAGTCALVAGCNWMLPGVLRDQAYYEDRAYNLGYSYDIVHGVARMATICEHDLEMECPDGRIDDPVLIEIDADWLPEHFRLDRSLPVLASEAFENETGIAAYFGLARFPGLPFQPDANVRCDGEVAEPGWRKVLPPLLHDSILQNDGIAHEGLQRAFEEGATDAAQAISEAGGVEQILCGGPD